MVLPAVINAVNYDRVFDVDTGSGCKLFWLPDSCFVVSSLVPWFEYYVNIPSEKDLNITLSMTTGLVPKWGTRYVSVSIDGIDVAKNIAVINEGIMDAGWQKINLYTVKGIHMTSGNHIVRVSFENGGTAFKFIQFN